jgi:valyl-tRNA synthetase
MRNARAEAGVEARAWLATDVAVPTALGATFEALRPAVERLARARPLERRLTREALPGGDDPGTIGALSVIAGELEAVIQRGDRGIDLTAEAAERSRLERELTEAEGYLAAARARLANHAFTTKAPPAVVEGARAREAELAEQVDRLKARRGPVGGRPS